jgi:hypothetical protein
MYRLKLFFSQILRVGWILLLATVMSSWVEVSLAQTLEDVQKQSQDLERAIKACGSDPACLKKVADRARELYKRVQTSPEITKLANTPCPGFAGASYPSQAGVGTVECLPLKVRLDHKATVATAGCTKEDERFTYAYVYESLGQLIRDSGRQAFMFNILAAIPDGNWRLDLQHVEYMILQFGDNCRPAGSQSFGRKDIDFGTAPSVMLSYSLGYTEPGNENIFFAPLAGWVSPRAARAHWGIGIPFQIGGGYTPPEELRKAGLVFSAADFEDLFEGQTLVRNLSWTDKQGGGKPGNQALRVEIKPAEIEKPPCKLRITSPKEGQKFVFSQGSPGQLTFNLTAKASPAKYGQAITWTMPQMDSATQIQLKPKNRRGPHLSVTLKGLPDVVSGLGAKVFVASVNDKDCHASATRTVKLFFPRDAKNNPKGKHPNWFYYWKQTPAGRPKGQIVALDYGGKTVDLCATAGVTGIYHPKFGYKVLQICDLSNLTQPFELVFPLLDRNGPKKYMGMRKVRNIDTFAAAVLHEFEHFLHDHNWYSKILPQNLPKMDKDKDGLPDHLEAGLNFSPSLFQTYYANHPKLKKVNGDEEWLAYESMRHYAPGSLDKYDWAHPGNQWP